MNVCDNLPQKAVTVGEPASRRETDSQAGKACTNPPKALLGPSSQCKHGAGQAVQPTEHVGNGDVQELRFDLKRVFNSEKLAYPKGLKYGIVHGGW